MISPAADKFQSLDPKSAESDFSAITRAK